MSEEETQEEITFKGPIEKLSSVFKSPTKRLMPLSFHIRPFPLYSRLIMVSSHAWG